MTPGTTRALRRGLLGLVVLVGTAVAWSIRKPAPPPPSPPPEVAAGATGTTVGELVFRRFKGEHEGLVLKARKMVGQEGEESRFEGVDVEIAYVARGKPGKARITSDTSRLTGQERAVFQGHVQVTTEDGFELETDTLVYNGNKGLARTADPVKFKRKELSGTATGMEYRAEAGELDLLDDVFLRIEEEPGPVTEVRAQKAELSRVEHVLLFTGEVRVVQGHDTLKAGRLRLELNEDLTAASRAVAADQVELRTSGSQPLPGTAGVSPAKGLRVLKAEKLDLWFREDRKIKEATASPDADLLVLPGPGEVQEKRRITSRVLAFQFDEEGRLVELLGQKDVIVTAEPLLAPGNGRRTVTGPNMVARLDPATGEPRRIEFDRGAEFREGTRVARGGAALFDGERNALVLQDEPELCDEADGSELRAATIEIASGSGDVLARGGVRQTRRGKASAAGNSFLSGGEGGSVIVAQRLDYAGQAKSATYRGKAILRAGRDEVRAETLVLEEPGPGRRRLTAKGEVVSLLTPRPKDAAAKAPAAVEGRAGEMVYDEAARRIVYLGDVAMRQGDIRTKSPKATLTLSADGNELEMLEAGEPAEIEQGQRRATGTRATYTPGNETVVVVGEKVILKDPGQQVEGRVLTFRVGDDTILVDGQEQVRTQAIITREPPSP